MRGVVMVATAAIALAVGLGAQAPTTPIFRMNCTAASWPRCGFDFAYTEREGTHFRRERLAGQAPSGRDAVRMTALVNSGQYEWGYIYIPRVAVPQGALRYLRWRFKLVSPIQWRASNGNAAGGKLVILGNLCEKSPYQPTRVISNLDASGGTAPFLRTEQNISGPPSRIDTTNGLALDVWHHMQVRVRSSSSASASDGLLSVYLDDANRSESTPTGQSTGGFRLLTAGWSTANGCGDSSIGFGNTFNALASGQHFVIEVADFEYDDAFDPTWGGTVSGVRPGQPAILRVI